MLAVTLTLNLIIHPVWKEQLLGACVAEPQLYAKKENLFNENGYLGCEGLFWEVWNIDALGVLKQQCAKQNTSLQVCT